MTLGLDGWAGQMSAATGQAVIPKALPFLNLYVLLFKHNFKLEIARLVQRVGGYFSLSFPTY